MNMALFMRMYGGALNRRGVVAGSILNWHGVERRKPNQAMTRVSGQKDLETLANARV
jgi:hypothetical protein